MNKNQKGFAGIIVVAIVALGLLGFGTYKVFNKSEVKEEGMNISAGGDFPSDYKPSEHKDNSVDVSNTNVKQSASANCGFSVTNISANQKVTFPLIIEGVIDNTGYKNIGCAWGMFEGVGGSAQLYGYNVDSDMGRNNGWQPIGPSVIIAAENWTTSTTKFKANIGNDQMGLKEGAKIKIVFTEEDPSGRGNSNTFELPLVYGSGSVSSTSNWKKYRNEKYEFEINYPSDWVVYESDDTDPMVNIYPPYTKTKPPFYHFTDTTNVSIFPRGIGSEGIYGRTRPAGPYFDEEIVNGFDYILKNGDAWATSANFKNFPLHWNRQGFIWARAAVTDFQTKCVLGVKEVDITLCQIGGEGTGEEKFEMSGTINQEERRIENAILKSFKFTK